MTADAVGGVWTYALDLAQGLRANGWDSVLAVLGPFREEKRREAEALGLSLIATGWPLDWMAEHPHDVERAGAACGALARDVGADIVHLNAPALAAGGAITVPTVGVCHSCVATWWSAVRGGEPPSAFRWRTELLRQGYQACDALLAPSAAFAQATHDLYGRWPLTVLNGRATDGRRYDPLAKSPTVLTSGRLWDPAKDAPCLDRASARLERPIRAAGALVGPNMERACLSSLELLGSLERPALDAELNHAGVFVSTALYEPFGLGVLEAAQAGCALVLSDIATFRELWQGAARFAPPRDDAALRQTIQDLLTDAEALRALARAAQRRARRYSLTAMTLGTLRAYRLALSTPAREAAA